MDYDKLSDKLLGETPENWPQGWRDTDIPLEKLPADTKDLLKAAIRREMSEPSSESRSETEPEQKGDELAGRRSRSRLWSIAAAILAAMVVPGVYFLVSGGADVRELSAVYFKGRGVVHRSGGKETVNVNTRLRKGDELRLESASGLVLKEGPALIRVRGPARLRVAELEGGKNPRLHLEVLQGSLAIRSPAGADSASRILWRTPGVDFVLKGTIARLRVQGEKTELRVLEGAFRATSRRGGPSRDVGPGRKLVLTGGGGPLPAVGNLDAREKASLRNMAANLERAQKGRPFIDEALNLNSEAAILRHYGKLHEVELRDGRKERGFALRYGNQVRIHTPFGVLNLPGEQVRAIRPL